MRPLAVVIPFKGAARKSRLASVLDATLRSELSEALLDGVLKAVARSGVECSILLVTSDREALRGGARAGVSPVPERQAGVNAAVRRGLQASEAAEALVLPADLPLLGPRDLRAVDALRKAGVQMVISPSRGFDGTNLLYLSDWSGFRLSYDRDSFWNHLREGARTGRRVAVYTGEGAVFDVDTPRDLERLAASDARIPGARIARGALR